MTTKLMPNYQLGKIYKLISDDDPNFLYIGSTTKQYLCTRLCSHKASAHVSNTPLYTRMREVGVNTVRIVLIENYPCNSKDELRSREDYWMDTFGRDKILNKTYAYRSTQDRINDKKARETIWNRSERGRTYKAQWEVKDKLFKRAIRDLLRLSRL